MDTPTYLQSIERAEQSTKNTDWDSAARMWSDVTAANPTSGYTWYRLGQAQDQRGEPEAALSAFEQAKERGVHHRRTMFVRLPAELSLDIARCHARLGDKTAAIDMATTAVAEGLYDLDLLSDHAFDAVRSDPRFQRLVIPAAPDDRDAGWRTDLQYLIGEILRRSPVAHRHRETVTRAAADLDQTIPQLSDARIAAEFNRILALLGDGHAYVKTTRPELPLRLFRFDDTVVVTAAAPQHADLVGCELVSIDGRSIEKLAAAVEPLISCDNGQQLLANGTARLIDLAALYSLELAARADRAVLEVTGPTGTRQVAVSAIEPAEPNRMSRYCPDGWAWLPENGIGAPLHLARLSEPYWFEHVTQHDLVYFGFNTVIEDEKAPMPQFFADMFAHIDEVDPYRFVIDVRWNGGGNTFKALELLNHILARPHLNRPDRLFIIIGRGTFSAAQNTATVLSLHTEATFVGEPTGSSPNFTGESIEFRLPYSRLRANVSDLYWQTSTPMDHRAWIEPELYVPPRANDWIRGHDPALAAITTYPRTKRE